MTETNLIKLYCIVDNFYQKFIEIKAEKIFRFITVNAVLKGDCQ
jgi:hypothetical protein